MGIEQGEDYPWEVVCVGDCGIDRYLPLNEDRPGGITYNFASHARRDFPSDATIHILTAVGTDDHGVRVSEALSRSECTVHARTMPGPTSLQEINLQEDGERIFTHYDQGVLDGYRLDEPEQAIVQQADLLVVPMFEQIREFFVSVMNIGCEGLIAVDFADISDYPAIDRVTPFVDRLDIAFFGLEPTQNTLIQELMSLAIERDKIFVVTMGRGGSVVATRSQRVFQPAVPVETVIDTTGAGDRFAAAFLAEYVKSRHLTHALRKAAHAAAVTVSRLGAT